MIPVEALESEWPPLSSLLFSLTSSMNSQTKTFKMRDDQVGDGDQFSAAKKYEGRIVNVVGLEERTLCPC
jgi:hypothetical protein